jgi:hypothetical protein
MQKRQDINQLSYDQIYERLDTLLLPPVIKCDGKLYNTGMIHLQRATILPMINNKPLSIFILKELDIEEAKEALRIQDENIQRLKDKGAHSHGA